MFGAFGLRPGEIVRGVTMGALAMVCGGAMAGFGIGMAMARYIESLIYQVKLTDFTILAVPVLTILGTTLLAAAPAVMRAVRIDPAAMLRAE